MLKYQIHFSKTKLQYKRILKFFYKYIIIHLLLFMHGNGEYNAVVLNEAKTCGDNFGRQSLLLKIPRLLQGNFCLLN